MYGQIIQIYMYIEIDSNFYRIKNKNKDGNIELKIKNISDHQTVNRNI
jgi:hypothetical protein